VGDRPIALPRVVHFVGRSHELSVFADRLDTPTHPAPIISVTGPGGIGKTTLVAQFEEAVRTRQFVSIRVDFENHRTFVDAIRSVANDLQHKTHLPQLTAAWGRLARVWTAVGGHASHDKAITATGLLKDFAGAGIGGTVGGLVAGPPGIWAGAVLGTIGGKLTEAAADMTLRQFTSSGVSTDDALFAMDPVAGLTEALVRDINEVSRSGTVVLFIDGHTAGSFVDEWLRLRVLAPDVGLEPDVPIVVVGRTPLSIEWRKGAREIVPLPITALASSEAKDLTRRLGVADDPTIHIIIEASRCIPWKIELLTEAVLAGVSLTHNDAQQLRESNVLFLERALSHLSESQRLLVEAASVLRRFDQDRLEAVIGGAVAATDFMALLTIGLLENDVTGPWGILEPVREEILDGIAQRSPQRLREYHSSAETYYLARLSSAGVPNVGDAVEAVYHALVGRPETAIEAVLAVFAQMAWPPSLVGCDAIVSEVALAERKHASWRDLRVYLQARTLCLQSAWDDAHRELGELSLPDSSDPSRAKLAALALEQRGWIDLHRGRLDAALREFQGAHAVFVNLGDTDRIDDLLNKLGRVTRRMGRWDLARKYHETVASDDPTFRRGTHARVEAHRCLSRLWRDRGQFEQALTECEKSVALARTGRHQYDEALGLSRIAELYCLLGRWSEARIACDSALPILRESKNDLAIGGAHHNAGKVAMWEGMRDEALCHYITALWFYRRLPANAGLVLLYLDLARFYILDRQRDRASRYLAAADTLADSSGGSSASAAVRQYFHGELARLGQEWTVAQEHFGAAVRSCIDSEDLHGQIESLIGLAMSQWHVSKTKASSTLKSASTLLDKNEYPDLRPRHDLTAAAFLYERGTHVKALAAGEAALVRARQFSPSLARSLARELAQFWKFGADERATFLRRFIGGEESRSPQSSFAKTVSLGPGGELVGPAPLERIAHRQQNVVVALHHTLSQFRTEGRIQGRLDSDVAADTPARLGRVSAAVVAELSSRAVNLKTVTVYTSPAKRAYETAFAVLQRLQDASGKVPTLQVLEELENICLGEWEGQERPQVADSKEYSRLSSGYDFGAVAAGVSADGIAGEEVLASILRGAAVLERISIAEHDAVVVGHRMTLMVAAALYWKSDLLRAVDGRTTWRALPVPHGGYLLKAGDEVVVGTIDGWA
jgi:broad specificity phosphatase PhoE/tetratricopeptide (TPR) repeat protein